MVWITFYYGCRFNLNILLGNAWLKHKKGVELWEIIWEIITAITKKNVAEDREKLSYSD